MQRVLKIETVWTDLTNKSKSWNYDGVATSNGYSTPLEALKNDWKLLAPPVKMEPCVYYWWFVKD